MCMKLWLISQKRLQPIFHYWLDTEAAMKSTIIMELLKILPIYLFSMWNGYKNLQVQSLYSYGMLICVDETRASTNR